MEQSSSSSCSIRKDEEWGFKTSCRRITRENTTSRRFSASYIRDSSFREDHFLNKSHRSNFTISSTASSPGCPLKDEIDPSTYSFTTALKALQARTVYNWECMSPDGLALNSKWYEAEKYISNPLSGQVPIECLSSKTLSARSFRNLTCRITMSAPLIYPSHGQHTRPMPTISIINDNNPSAAPYEVEKKMEGVTMTLTRDVGTQSTPPDINGSSSPSPSSTPSIKEKGLNRYVSDLGDTPKSVTFSNSEEQVETVTETREDEETKTKNKKRKDHRKWGCKQGAVGCIFFTSFWTARRSRMHREKQKQIN